MRQPWAKLVRDAEKRVVAALPLIDHCLDVGAVAEVVLRAWIVPLTAAAGRALTELDIVRLVVLAALHDLGKANLGFQARIDIKASPIGHTRQVAALLEHSKLRNGIAGGALNDLIDDWGASQHFVAVMAHHGKPLSEFCEANPLGRNWEPKNYKYWKSAGNHDPVADVAALIAAIRAHWPQAWEPGVPLPDAPRFVALFAGLVTLADWLGSDSDRFPVDGPHGADREPLRRTQALAVAEERGFLHRDTPSADFKTALRFPPHGFQTAAAAADLGPVALIEAETGSGKTEAALWRWIELRRRGEVDGLFFALPTRSAAVQLHRRVNDTLDRLWGRGRLKAVLAVPGYLRVGDAEGQALPDFRVRWNDRSEPGGDEDPRWAAERANRFLSARVAVGTIDQALLGTLPVKHALFRAGVLARSLLVVDEVHASDTYMAGLLERLLDHHVAVGGRALLLSATLGATARAGLLKSPRLTLAEAEAQPYPALSGRAAPPRAATGATTEKRVRIDTAGLIADPDAIAARAVEAARAGAAVLVVRNTVAGAVAVAQAVAMLAPDLAFRVADVPTLHHGRFAPCDRQLLDTAVGVAFGKGRAAGGRILVGTQTLEQSLDIDADYLITDLAPIDVLLQRIGRLHRHPRDDRGAFGDARVLVLRPAERDLTPLLDKDTGRHGLGGTYPDLVQLEATLRVIEASPDIVIPRDNRRLVEHALHPEALDAVARDLGVAWQNRNAQRSSGEYAKRQSAETIALDLSKCFSELVYPSDDDMARVTTRLGARDLLIDLPQPLTGPFRTDIARVTVPAWMARGVSDRDEAERIDERRFRLGPNDYAYDQWGLRKLA